MDKKVGLTFQDILVLIDVINLASTRNAFRIEEFSTVGDVFQKLTSIVQAARAENTLAAAPNSTQEANAEGMQND